MLVARRLAGLSALEGHYAGVTVSVQFGGACWLRGSFLLGVGERGRPLLPIQKPTSLNASSRWRQKTEQWQEIAGLGDDGVVTSLGKDGDHADFKRKECNE